MTFPTSAVLTIIFFPLLCSDAYEQSAVWLSLTLYHCLITYVSSQHTSVPPKEVRKAQAQKITIGVSIFCPCLFLCLLWRCGWLSLEEKEVHSRRLLAHDRERRNCLIQKNGSHACIHVP